jgi:diaminopimelate decarboxylase
MVSIKQHKDSLNKLTKDIGSPFFFYDIDVLGNNLKSIKTLPVKLWYAVKANPLSSIIATVSEQDISFDVASIGELDQVLKQNVDPKNILHTGPAKSYNQLCYFLEKGVRIFVLESIQQYEDLSKASKVQNVQTTALLRVQLKWEDFSEKNVLGGDSVTPFGLPPQIWQEYFSTSPIKNNNIDIIGLHCFQWGNITSADKLYQLWQTITRSLVDLASQIKIDLQVIDLGGGLGIPYHKESKRLDVNYIKKALNTLKAEYPQVDFWLELGRYAVGECGIYATQIIDKKKLYDKTLLILEGGSHHLIRPFISNQAFPVFNLNKDNESSTTMELHGPLCTSIDHLGSIDLSQETKVGDTLIFKQVGAYGFTESMPFFLCHTLPAEIIYKKGQIKIIREAKQADVWLV